MRDALPTLKQWTADARRFALATVTHTWGSSPRPVGSVMAVREDGVVWGSVSGGCVESAVIQAALEALATRLPRELDFGSLSDESVWEVGLSCGGRIQVWIDPDPVARNPDFWHELIGSLDIDRPLVLLTRLEPLEQMLWSPESTEWTGGPELLTEVECAFQKRLSRQVEIDGRRYFLQVLAQRDRLVIVGAVHIAVPLVKFARELGFETVVVDPRTALTTAERFPEGPDRVIVAWPEQAFQGIELTPETYAAILTHDPKIDDVALRILLRSPAAYIGALGSRTTQAKRRKTLAEEGFTEEQMSRIHGPIGLDIGARSPEEIALSIIAEIVKVRRARG